MHYMIYCGVRKDYGTENECVSEMYHIVKGGNLTNTARRLENDDERQGRLSPKSD